MSEHRERQLGNKFLAVAARSMNSGLTVVQFVTRTKRDASSVVLF